MAEPSFFTDGATPRRTNTRWELTAKWLGVIQNNLGGSANSANNPRRDNTRRQLLVKINKAKAGV